MFREANSFPRVKLEETCELRGTDNVQGQISELSIITQVIIEVLAPSLAENGVIFRFSKFSAPTIVFLAF